MGSVDRIEQHVAGIKLCRIDWIAEKPHVPAASQSDAQTFLAALRGEYRWYRDQRERLVAARKAIDAMIEECDFSMDEAQGVADLMADVNAKLQEADKRVA